MKAPFPTLHVDVTRGMPTMHGTPGQWVTRELGWTCRTLELPWVNNERGCSCIIADSYLAKLALSKHLGGPNHQVYRLEDKHGRFDCEIHNANFAGEVRIGDVTQLHGCTAVGRGYGMIERPGDGKEQWGILHSVKTLEELIAAHNGADLIITYAWAPGCNAEEGAWKH